MNSYRAHTIHKANVTGTVYLLRFSQSYKGRWFYCGFTTRPLDERIAEHIHGNGAALTRAAVLSGASLEVVRTWENVDQSVEFLIKCRGGHAKLSPVDNPNGWHRLANYGATK